MNASGSLSLRSRVLLRLLKLRRLSPVAMATYARRHTAHYARAHAGPTAVRPRADAFAESDFGASARESATGPINAAVKTIHGTER